MDNDELYTFKVIISTEKYYNEDTTWGSYIGYTDDDIPFCVRESNNSLMEDNFKPKNFCNIVGKMQQLSIGCEYQIKAKHEFNKTYGWTVSKDGRIVTTSYLDKHIIEKATTNNNNQIVIIK